MRRAEALKLVGERVEAWTAMNGVYVGRLLAVSDSRPWRGRVVVESVLEPAVAFDRTRPGSPRRGFRAGEELEVGAQSIRVATEDGVSYEEALRRDRDALAGLLETSSERDRWWLERALAIRESQLKPSGQS